MSMPCSTTAPLTWTNSETANEKADCIYTTARATRFLVCNLGTIEWHIYTWKYRFRAHSGPCADLADPIFPPVTRLCQKTSDSATSYLACCRRHHYVEYRCWDSGVARQAQQRHTWLLAHTA